MPIKVPNNIPAVQILSEENVFVMTEARALTQDIRPLKILILNIMPTKIDTETQLIRLLGNTPLQVEIELIHTKSHVSKNTSLEHIQSFYKTFSEIKDKYYDGMIVTGAPVELLRFEEVDYWEELCSIMAWADTHIHSTLYICWGAQAALYFYYGIDKYVLGKKLFGVFPHRLEQKRSMLFRGFDDDFMVPHSRMTTILRKDIEKTHDLIILSTSKEAGIYAVSTKDGSRIFITGHPEYDQRTLEKEYQRDLKNGSDVELPINYYPHNDMTKDPLVTWKSHANLLYANWLNYFVYQSTPYDLLRIPEYTKSRYSINIVHNIDNDMQGMGKIQGQTETQRKVFKNEANKRYVILSAPNYSQHSEKILGDLYENRLNPEIPDIAGEYASYNGIIKARKMIIGLLGFGVVGKGVYEVIAKREDMEIKYVFDRKDIPELGSKLTHDINFILEDSEIDTVIELLGGVEPAFGYAEKALTCGKNLVTANKMMMASHYGSLSSLAREKDAMLCYTAAVGGAIPWIVNLDRASRVSQINEISGIINGTTNYILTAMHSRKLSFRYALAEAQKLGYAEADPSSDIDGIDICNKCVLSANIAFGIDIPQEEVQVFGIGSVNESDIKNAEAMGYRIKMFADAIRNGEGLNIWVEPVFVPHDSMEASIHDNFNLVSFVSELTGKESFYGQGAGRYPTASNVVQDCVDIIYGRKLLYNEVMIKAKIANNIKYRYYVRCDFDEFIMQIEEQRGDGYIITKPVCVHEIHEWAKRNKDDQKLFFASIRKEDQSIM